MAFPTTETLGNFGIKVPRPKAQKAPAEPHGQGQRVVLQRIPGLTARGILERPFLFQCPPLNEFPVQYGWDFIDFDTVGAGYRTRPGSSQLTSVSFDTLFVDEPVYAHFAINKSVPANPIELVAELRAIGDAKTPFQVVAGQPELWGVSYDVNMAATMRSLRSSEQAGERDARYVSVSFTEFPGVTPAAIAASVFQAGKQTDNSAVAVLDVNQLGAGTTLRDLSQRYYGTTTLWTVIGKASGIKVAASVDLRAHFRGTPTPPKIVVPAPAIARAAR
jgi:hypothetical protein